MSSRAGSEEDTAIFDHGCHRVTGDRRGRRVWPGGNINTLPSVMWVMGPA